MKFLIVGYGSIGKRHARNLRTLGHEVELLRRSSNNVNAEGIKEYYSFDDALKSTEKLDGAIVCSPTSNHLSDVEILIKNNIPFLLEKPPAVDLDSTLKIKHLVQRNDFKFFDVGFNLRYYPVLEFINDFLPNLGDIYSVRVSAGSYLPDWRKGSNYRETCSARRELGGGVHIELCHEIDYIIWFFGLPEKVFGYINKISKLEISTEDICSAIFQYENGSIVEMHLDYLSHKNLRGCQIIGENGTLEWNICSGNIFLFERGDCRKKVIFCLSKDYDFNDTYLKELIHFFAFINNTSAGMLDIEEAVNIMKVVEAIKISSNKGGWVKLRDL